MTIQAEQWRSDIFSLVDESSVDYQRVGVTISFSVRVPLLLKQYFLVLQLQSSDSTHCEEHIRPWPQPLVTTTTALLLLHRGIEACDYPSCVDRLRFGSQPSKSRHLHSCTVSPFAVSNEATSRPLMMFDDGYDQREWSSALPFRLGARTTTIYKAVPNTNLTGILDHLDAIGEIEWRLFGPFIMQLRGKKMNTDQFIPRPWFHGAGTDIQGARWSPV
ncbi:hypothetical protein J3A83DRAFT_4184535 [Scleroderma citrinum]